MKPIQVWVLLNAAILTFAAVAAVAQSGSTKVPPGHVLIPAGERMVVQVTATEREYILNQMRSQLDMLWVMSDALSRNDMPTVALAANARGTATLARQTASVYEKTPIGFRNLIRENREKMDQIAVDADNNLPQEVIMGRLSELVKTCTECHAVWQLRVTPQSRGKR